MAERVLFDVNVVLDAMLRRQPHAAAAEALWAEVEAGSMRGYVPAHGVTTIFYLLRKQVGIDEARRVVGLLLQVFRVARVDARVIASALALSFADFEDAVCAAAAAASRCGMIVTRDPKGFAASIVRAVPPEVALTLLATPPTSGARRSRPRKRKRAPKVRPV